MPIAFAASRPGRVFLALVAAFALSLLVLRGVGSRAERDRPEPDRARKVACRDRPRAAAGGAPRRHRVRGRPPARDGARPGHLRARPRRRVRRLGGRRDPGPACHPRGSRRHAGDPGRGPLCGRRAHARRGRGGGQGGPAALLPQRPDRDRAGAAPPVSRPCGRRRAEPRPPRRPPGSARRRRPRDRARRRLSAGDGNGRALSTRAPLHRTRTGRRIGSNAGPAPLLRARRPQPEPDAARRRRAARPVVFTRRRRPGGRQRAAARHR